MLPHTGQFNDGISTPSYLIDVMPTFLELAGASYPITFNNNSIYRPEGRSMAPLFKGKTIPQHEYMYWEHEGNQAIRKGNWKAVKDRDNKSWELFNLMNDRSEEHNLAGEQTQLLNELITTWKQWANSHFVFPKKIAARK